MRPPSNHPQPEDPERYSTCRFDQRLGEPGAVWSGRLEQVFGHAAVAHSDVGDVDLTLLHPSRDLVPLGVLIPWSRLRPQVGDRVRFQGGYLELADGHARPRIVALRGAGVSLRLAPGLAGCRLALRLQLGALELPERTDELLGKQIRSAGSVARAECLLLRRRLDVLTAALVDADRDLEHRARGLIGLGSGATPSGDDVLLGALAAARRFAACGWLDRQGVDRLATCLRSEEVGATTPASQAMLGEGALGNYPEALLEVVQLLGAPGVRPERLAIAIRRLAAVGHNSGADMLAGVLGLARRVISWKGETG